MLLKDIDKFLFNAYFLRLFHYLFALTNFIEISSIKLLFNHAVHAIFFRVSIINPFIFQEISQFSWRISDYSCSSNRNSSLEAFLVVNSPKESQNASFPKVRYENSCNE